MSSGVIQCPAGTVTIPRGITNLLLSGLSLASNIVLINGDSFQITDAGTYLLDVSLQASAYLTDLAYTLELYDENTSTVIQSFQNSVPPASAPAQQQFQFTFIPDVTHVYKVRVNAPNGGQPNKVMQLFNNASAQIVVTSLTGGGGGGGASITPITYAALATAIGGSTLTAGQYYKITDFATVHYIVDSNGTQYTINTGATEPLIVLATSTNTLAPEASSPAFPQDVIYYDWNPANWTDDLSFSAAGVIVPGFTGVIYLRNDTLYSNSLGYDFRNVVFRRWKTNQPAWDIAVTYDQNGIVLGSDGWIYASLVAVNLGNDPATGANQWAKLLNTTKAGGGYWNSNPANSNGIVSDAASFADLKTFAEGAGTATYALSVRSNSFVPFKDVESYFDSVGTLLPNNVFFLADSSYYNVYGNTGYFEFNLNTFGEGFFSGNDIGAGFSGNQFQGNVQNNIFGPLFNFNVLGNDFNNNSVFGNFTGNFVGSNFSRNVSLSGIVQDARFGNAASQNRFAVISHSRFKTNCQNNDFVAVTNSYFGAFCTKNVIGIGFDTNTAGDTFADNVICADCTINTFGDTFTLNTVAGNCSTNSFGSSCTNNVIGPDFQNNTVGSNFLSNSIGAGFLTNVIADDFELNLVGAGFVTNTTTGSCTNNTFGSGVTNNTLADNFSNNVIGAAFASNTIGTFFQLNQVGSGVFALTNMPTAVRGVTVSPNFSTVDFTGALIVAQNGSKTLFANSAGVSKISYVDAAGVFTVAAANA